MDFDVLVVGAGIGGCLVARDIALQGYKVGLFDLTHRENLGKPVIIEIEKAIFGKTSASYPHPDEIPYHSKRTRVFTKNGKEAFTVDGEHPAVAVYLDKFTRKLLTQAESAGAVFYGGYRAESPIVEGNRVAGVRFFYKEKTCDIKARLVIDASGFNAVIARKLDADFGINFPNNPADVVRAENRFYEIDTEKARQAIEQGKAGDEEVWARFGFTSPYSTEYSHLSLANRKAYILIGYKAEYNGQHPSRYIDSFINQQGYFAKQVHGGRGLIRIRHSLDKLVADGFMAVGEAACTVIPTHGSGGASALYTGKLAAETAVYTLKANDVSTKALWSYSWKYQTTRGSLLATFDISRLTIDSLTTDQVNAMLESKVTTPEDFRNAAVPKGISLSPRSTFIRLKGLAKNPSLIAPIIRMAQTATKVGLHYRRYPKHYNREVFEEWKKRKEELFKPFQR